MLFTGALTVPVERGGAKPSICVVLSSSFLFNHVSVKARIEALLYSCMWLTLACNSSILLRRE